MMYISVMNFENKSNVRVYKHLTCTYTYDKFGLNVYDIIAQSYQVYNIRIAYSAFNGRQ